MKRKYIRIPYVLIAALVIAVLAAANGTRAQSPASSPSADPTSQWGDFKVTSSFEFGYRYLDVNGDRDKFRSDLNYKKGLRLFDSSFLIEANGDARRFIDTALITATGWGADPSSSATVKLSKAGAFKFDSNVRRVVYFNNLKNFATNWSQRVTTGSEHQFNTRHYLGDFDLTLLPDNEKLRVRMGYGFNDTNGPGFYTIRWPQFTGLTTTTRGDEFMVNTNTKNRSDDIRLGAEGQLAGFNWGLNWGHRQFTDKQKFFVDRFNAGNSPLSNTASINSFAREFPTKGKTDYGNAFFQRTIQKKLDLTGRLIYSSSRSRFQQSDTGNGLSSFSSSSVPQLIIDLDQADVTGRSRRLQTRGDLGATWMVNDVLRVSDTFNFDQFNITGDNLFVEYLLSRTLSGTVRPADNSRNTSWRATHYRRYTNLVEADLQVNRMFGFHAGYRYTDRMVGLGALDINRLTSATALNEAESFSNKTHTFIAGTKIRPVSNWSIWADFERGTSDTPFTRLANGKVLNFRAKTHATLKNLGFSASFISKDNDVPGESECNCTVTTRETTARTKSRIFNSSIEWTPRPALTVSSGYNYNWMNTDTDIIVPVGSPTVSTTTWFVGQSRYFMRDSYFYFDVAARPHKRVAFYASYRINNDPGQGSQIATRTQDIFTSYPVRFQTPEARVAFRLARNVDWNVGYQYYSYRETVINNPLAFIVITGSPNANQVYPAQNYSAHMPYTSLRIYFGGDR